ncbi:hypothetical protein ACFFWC_16985 [Plantactinospora siamensis]|uniref:Uncharacterized protein n=1 Tax=Plantactinospora siamensis TaxID=555372 RepID=A0ABV6NV40_9ACTN
MTDSAEVEASGVPVPAPTKRSRADLRARALELRRLGRAVPRIADQLGIGIMAGTADGNPEDGR